MAKFYLSISELELIVKALEHNTPSYGGEFETFYIYNKLQKKIQKEIEARKEMVNSCKEWMDNHKGVNV